MLSYCYEQLSKGSMKAIIILCLSIPLCVSAQKQQRTLFIYNGAFGGVTAGIGSVINKPCHANWKTTFIKGFWQGAIGGILNYSGKKLLYPVNKQQNSLYAWPAKILHAAGYSIVENAALNEPFLQNWHMDYGLFRIDLSFNKKKSFKVRLLPEAVVATVIAGQYGKFDLSSSLMTGEIIFKSRRVLDLPNTQPAEGATFGRVVVYVENDQSYYGKDRILSHELVHRYQYNEYQVFNTWLKPVGDKIKSKQLQTIFSRYVYFDAPYAFIPYYIIGQYRDAHFYQNFYEFEAERFSTNEDVQR